MTMRCEDIQSVLIDFVDDRLDAIRRQEVVTHLEVCENCRQEESQLRELLRAVAETPEEQPRSTLRENFNRLMQSPPTAHGAEQTIPGSTESTGVPAKTPVKKLPLHLPAIGWNSPVSRVAVAILLLLTGFAIGSKTANNRDGTTPTQMAEL